MSAPTVGVCGFGRCGSTMVMAMLDAGGCPPVAGSFSGSYEVEDFGSLYRRRPGELAGRAVKLLDGVSTFGAPPAPEWRLVWLDRDPVEQAKSQVKFASGILGVSLGADAVMRFAASYQRDRPASLAALRRRGPVTVLRYERALADPRKAAKRLRQAWPDLDVIAAAGVVHDRDGGCRPDLSVEVALTGDGQS